MAGTENIVVATFPEESTVFQAFSEIKGLAANPDVRIEGLVIVRRAADGSLQTPDVAATGHGNSVKGGLVGSLIGILGGPIGVLLGWGTGALLGGLRDASEVRSDYAMLQRLTEEMRPGETALVGHLREESPYPVDAIVRRLGGEVLRRPSDDVEAEIANAEREHGHPQGRQQEQEQDERQGSDPDTIGGGSGTSPAG